MGLFGLFVEFFGIPKTQRSRPHSWGHFFFFLDEHFGHFKIDRQMLSFAKNLPPFPDHFFKLKMAPQNFLSLCVLYRRR